MFSRTIRLTTALAAAAIHSLLLAQAPSTARPLSPGDGMDATTLSRNVQALRRATALSSDAATRADNLIHEASSLLSAGQSGQARRKLAAAHAVITGQPWTTREEYLWSLALRPRAIVMEPSAPQAVDVVQLYAADYKPAQPIRLAVSLVTAEPTPRPVRNLTSADLPSRDLVAEPLVVPLAFAGIADGTYRLSVQVVDGDTPVATLQHTVAVANGIDARRADIDARRADVEKRLARIAGHESAKATVRWPFDMARVVNHGIRKLETGDFGLPESGGQVFDFARELRESEQVLLALESGRDPLFRARGDHERHYWFADAGEIMPYRVYVPMGWDGKKKLPMLFVLHGNTRDHNFYFDRDGGILAKLAEKHGFLVATVMGYRPSAGYNASAITSMLSTPPAATRSGGFVRTAAMQRETELSEKDAMTAFDLIVKEFTPDPARIYLFGHSAGGTGGWYIGSKYRDRFAGLALSAFVTQPARVPFDRLTGKPILVIVGSRDAPRTVETARTMAKAVKERGFKTEFLEIPEATHDTIVGLALPRVFEFFLGK